jgi:hypothetical protein
VRIGLFGGKGGVWRKGKWKRRRKVKLDFWLMDREVEGFWFVIEG